jgi:hypothetical protein
VRITLLEPPAPSSQASPRYRLLSNRDQRNQQALEVTRGLSSETFREIALVKVLVGGLALVHTIATPVDHGETSNQGNILCTGSGHGGFKHVCVML